MKYEEKHGIIYMESKIKFDDTCLFCGSSYITINAYKTDDWRKFGWYAGDIAIGVTDDNYFLIGLIYRTENKQFNESLGRLKAWMEEHEKGVYLFENLVDKYNFFPDLGCERIEW